MNSYILRSFKCLFFIIFHYLSKKQGQTFNRQPNFGINKLISVFCYSLSPALIADEKRFILVVVKFPPISNSKS